MYPYIQLENHKFNKVIAGVDEAGRGSLIGPVVVAAVILSTKINTKNLKDSKLLTHQQRKLLAHLITKKALAYKIAITDAKIIDKINILQATLKAMKQAIENLKIIPNLALIDGNKCPNSNIKCQYVIKGDSYVPSIQAASILAKYFRDLMMYRLDLLYPKWNIAKHKGYATKEHINLIKQYGILPQHRKSFNPIKSLIKQKELFINNNINTY